MINVDYNLTNADWLRQIDFDQKFNPFHDDKGRFSEGNGAGIAELRPTSLPGNERIKSEDFIRKGVKDIADEATRGHVKGQIVEDLTNRLMKDSEAVKALHDSKEEEMLGRGVPEEVAMYNAVNRRIKKWSDTASDQDPRALSMQMAAREEFGLKNADPYIRSTEHALDRVTEILDAAHKIHTEQGTFNRRFLRAVYENTQEELKKAGIREVELQRGMEFYRKEVTEAGAIYMPSDIAQAVAGDKGQRRQLTGASYYTLTRRGTVTNLKTQPLNSWTSEGFVAMRFGDVSAERYDGVLLRATVPASRIFSTARTGPGCLNEHEFIVFDTPGTVGVTVKQRKYD